MDTVELQNDYSVYEHAMRTEMVDFVPESSKIILDVGCSVGNFGALLKSERECEVWGVELDAAAAAIAEAKLDTVVCGPFGPGLGLPEHKFDCVIFNYVLEHMVDPYSALSYAKTLLTPGGKVVASLPHVRYFGNIWLLVAHKSWKYEDAGILDRTHLRFFTETSIREMFEEQDYIIEKLQGINPLEQFDGYYLRKFKLLNLLSLNRFSDMRWYQFAVVAVPVAEL